MPGPQDGHIVEGEEQGNLWCRVPRKNDSGEGRTRGVTIAREVKSHLKGSGFDGSRLLIFDMAADKSTIASRKRTFVAYILRIAHRFSP